MQLRSTRCRTTTDSTVLCFTLLFLFLLGRIAGVKESGKSAPSAHMSTQIIEIKHLASLTVAVQPHTTLRQLRLLFLFARWQHGRMARKCTLKTAGRITPDHAWRHNTECALQSVLSPPLLLIPPLFPSDCSREDKPGAYGPLM